MRQRISFEDGGPAYERELFRRVMVPQFSTPDVEGLNDFLFCAERTYHPLSSAISRMRGSEKRSLNARLILALFTARPL